MEFDRTFVSNYVRQCIGVLILVLYLNYCTMNCAVVVLVTSAIIDVLTADNLSFES